MNSAMAMLCRFFVNFMISTGHWPPHSPYLSPCNYFLWGYEKDHVFLNVPMSIAEIKTKISKVIGSIDQTMLKTGFHNKLSFIEA